VSHDSSTQVSVDHRTQVYATLLSAFTEDPVARWLFPDVESYLLHFPKFIAALGGRAFEADGVWRLEEFAAVALWLSPGTDPDDDASTAALVDTVNPALHADLVAVGEQIGLAHPTFPHWYLPWFGVEAGRQGSGLGSQLMPSCLEVVDGSHLPAYLETSNPRTISFYQRHGFEVTGRTTVSDCPPLTFMQRPAG
jgi:ribosomal protein S18 acetylase RimI-like enzyme